MICCLLTRASSAKYSPDGAMSQCFMEAASKPPSCGLYFAAQVPPVLVALIGAAVRVASVCAFTRLSGCPPRQKRQRVLCGSGQTVGPIVRAHCLPSCSRRRADLSRDPGQHTRRHRVDPQSPGQRMNQETAAALPYSPCYRSPAPWGARSRMQEKRRTLPRPPYCRGYSCFASSSWRSPS